MELDNFLNTLESLMEWAISTGEPMAGAAMLIVILTLILSYVIWRVKSEMRGLKWNSLTFEERKAKIEAILTEAIKIAEWLYSNLEPSQTVRKNLILTQMVSEAKRSEALSYASKQLKAAGGTRQDLATLPLSLEKVLNQHQPNKIRYGSQMQPIIDEDIAS